MSQSNNSLLDPVRPVTFVAGNSPGGLHGQSMDNQAAKHSQFIDPVNPSNYDPMRNISGAEEARAGTDALLVRAIKGLVALSFVAANFFMVRNLLQSPGTWSQGGTFLMVMQYGLGVITTTLTLIAVGTIALFAVHAAITAVKRLLKH